MRPYRWRISFVNGDTTVDADALASQELRNHYVPLMNWLKSQHRQFTAGVEPTTPLESLESVATDAEVRQWLRQARDSAAREEWLSSLPAWTRLICDAGGPVRREAILQRVRCLQQLDQPYLAECELRGRMLYDPDPEVRRMALEALTELLRDADDQPALRRLLAAAVWADPSAERITALAEALAEWGEWQSALEMSLAILPDRRPWEAVLASSFQLDWWQLFDHACGSVTDEAVRVHWTAWRNGQPPNRVELARHFAWGSEIAAALSSPDAQVRIDAIQAWGRWEATHPGSRIWRAADELVTRSGRSARLVSDENHTDWTMYVVAPDEPTWLSVQGPAEVRLEVRPLHDGSSDEPLSDWLHVKGSGREYLFPLIENKPSASLTVNVGESKRVPGRQQECTFRVGPGWHRLCVTSERHSILIRPALRRPAFRLPVLPELSCAAVRRVLSSDGSDPTAEIATSSLAASSGISEQPGRASFGQVSGACRPCRFPLVVLTDCGAYQELQACCPTRSSCELAMPPEPWEGWPSADARTGDANEAWAELPAPNQPYDVDTLAQLIAQRQYAQIARGTPDDVRDARELYAAALLWWAESDDAQRPACLVQLITYARQYPQERMLTAIVERLSEEGQWDVFREVAASAGISRSPARSPQPQYQAVQVRYQLAPKEPHEIGSADYILTGNREINLRVVEARELKLELAFWQPSVAFRRAPQLVVELFMGDRPLREIPLPTLDQVERFQLDLAPGSHQVRLRIKQPYAGHDVLLQLREITPEGRRIAWNEWDDLKRPEEFFHVATAEQPVKFRVQGPAWLQIQRFSATGRHQRETAVVRGMREFELGVVEGQPHTLYQIREFRFRGGRREPPIWAVDASQPPSQRRWLDIAAGPNPVSSESLPEVVGIPFRPGLLESMGLSSADEPAPWVSLVDPFPLGGQEDGTWGVGGGPFHRRALEEGRFGSGRAPDRFIQAALSYEQYDGWDDVYQQTRLMIRFRDATGPSAGWTYDNWQPLTNWIDSCGGSSLLADPAAFARLDRWQVHHQMSAYVQRPTDAFSFYEDQTEGSLGYRGQIYRSLDITERIEHLPSFTFLARWLSLDEPSYVPGQVDQDIFTPFKNDHRVAIYMSDTIAYNRRENQRWWLRPALYTNEDLNIFRPDHISLQVGVSSLWRNLAWDVAYRVARYDADADRPRAVNQQLLYLDATLDHWENAGSQFELDIRLIHELDDGETSAYVTLTRYLSRGRGYRDHHPSQVGFRRLRERRNFPDWWNAERPSR